MEIPEKIKLLNKIDTKPLITKLHEYENELEKALNDQAMFVAKEYEYICTRGNDCQAVKAILAELLVQAPETGPEGKKTTVADREAWLQTQRKTNKELSEAMMRQRQAAFLVDDWQIKVEMTKKRLEGVKIVLGLRTQQVAFLASN